MKLRRSTLIPLLLLIYLAVMAYIGRDHLSQENSLYYFGVIAGTLAVIVILHFTLKRRETLRREREEDLAGRNQTDKKS
ncbi:MAG: hypothetical protein K2M94_02225 [Paramuribaculum sp.]|nr:hypothetical protein [Paramuribaculum sp.]